MLIHRSMLSNSGPTGLQVESFLSWQIQYFNAGTYVMRLSRVVIRCTLPQKEITLV